MVIEAAQAARRNAHAGVQAVPAVFGIAVLAQVAYPLTSGAARSALTIAIVLIVAAAALLHALLSRGPRAVITLAVVTVLGGFAVEVVGVHTGVPFGRYHYSDTLGAQLFGVPLVIAFAWSMLAWPAALAARRLCRSFPARVAVGAWALAAWDAFLDPQMVAAGHWTWADPSAHLPGVAHVPLTDYAGWLLVSLAISFGLQSALRSLPDADDRWPVAFYVWTWASSVLALAAFLDLGAAALWGGLAMGVIAVPLARSALR
ncbi:MAG TPA: carotenoid biosynthesis protein [Jatrophihabitans sp.]|jgi:putative membrane protein